MSISNLTILSGSTMAASGGSDLVFESRNIENGVNKLFVPADSTLVLQRSMDLSITMPKPKVDAPDGYTQGRANVFMRFPHTLNDGGVSVDTASVKFAQSVETTAAEKLEQRKLLAQSLVDPEMISFWDNLSN